MDNHQQKIHQLKQMIEKSRRTVVFTGAGISTESGIPDFRSPGGIWTKMKPIDFKDYMASEEIRREAWRRKFSADSVFGKAKPNSGHMAVAKLAQSVKLSAVVTQNIDGLHQMSGVPEDQVIEIHGNANYCKCLECEKRYELTDVQKIFENNETLPVCDCGGIIKTATISFGQAMPVREVREAERVTLECDLFLAIGSSLVVYPAAGFPVMAKRNGAELVILNREPTGMDSQADLVIHGEIGPTLSEAVERD